jgi:hypothetical protein
MRLMGLLLPVRLLGLSGCHGIRSNDSRWPESMGHTVSEQSWKDADFLCNSCFLLGGYKKLLCVCGDGKYYFRSGFSVTGDVSALEA